MSSERSEVKKSDFILLFIGAFAQWMLSALFARWTVERNVPQVFVLTFIAQSMWYFNIIQVTKQRSIGRWIFWTLGAASGAALGTWI